MNISEKKRGILKDLMAVAKNKTGFSSLKKESF